MTDQRDSGRVLDRDLAPVASLIGDPTRIAILAALAEGHALPAGELAHRAGVHPATATAHLRQLVDGGLVSVRVQGRHRYHELAGPRVAAVVEALAQLAPATPVRSLRSDRAARNLAEARTCYDHLAGRRGVELRDRLLAVDALQMVDDRDHRLTPRGHRLVGNLGIDARQLNMTRTGVRPCLRGLDAASAPSGRGASRAPYASLPRAGVGDSRTRPQSAGGTRLRATPRRVAD